MSTNDIVYKTVQGFVFAGPWENEANGKKIRSFVISVPTPVLSNEEETRVRITTWDSHEKTPVKIGDLVYASGKFEIIEKQNDQGNYEKSYSVSANKFVNLGNGLGGSKGRSVSVDDEPTTDGTGKVRAVRRPDVSQIPGL